MTPEAIKFVAVIYKLFLTVAVIYKLYLTVAVIYKLSLTVAVIYKPSLTCRHLQADHSGTPFLYGYLIGLRLTCNLESVTDPMAQVPTGWYMVIVR